MTWNWSREIRGRLSNELNELQADISTLDPPARSKDGWKWVLDSEGIFVTRTLSSLIDDPLLCNSISEIETMRNNLVPSKLRIFIWRIIHGRLPVRVELEKRGIDLGSTRCPTCDDDIETIEHAFISCKHARDIWDRVYKWWGAQHATNFSIEESFCGNNGAIKSGWGSKLWQAIEWITGYVI
ncbi:uncharacterized protein [Rutidosis leptorrhynchoides]|uniref:uncharacterized protein n=1 Tax=Rutidosis leptorrhynchoides TaxID=125765 RepID=UPI003A994D78